MPTLTLQPDSGSSQDVNIAESQSTTSNPTAANTIRLNPPAGFRRVGVLKFDLSSLSGATIISATLSITTIENLTFNTTMAVYRVLAANSGWVSSATWNYANPSTVRWAGDTGSDGFADAGCSVSGTDYHATAMATQNGTNGEASGTVHSFALDVTQFGLVVANNYGFLVRRTDGGSTGINYASSRHATAGYRPKLVVEYTMPNLIQVRQPMWGRYL